MLPIPAPLAASLFLLAVPVAAGATVRSVRPADAAAQHAERTGSDAADAPPLASVRDPEAAREARRRLGTSGLLFVPDSTNDRVMAFDPVTGDLVDADFVPADPTNLSTPKAALIHPWRGTLLVSDQLDDVVQEYDLDGVYLGVFAPAGGPNPAILDNILGLAFRSNGELLVTVTGGVNQDAIAAFDLDGMYVGNFVANGAGGLDGPFDVFSRPSDWLVTGINSDDLNRYDTAGGFLAELAALSDFPQQIAEAANGNLLIGNFSGTQEGVVELTAAGVPVAVLNPPEVGGNRGAFELPGGNILTTNGAGVHEVDRSGVFVESKITGVSAQYIEAFVPRAELTIPGLPASPTIDGAIAPGEWAGAAELDIAAGPTPVTLRLAHRGVELFVAVEDHGDATLDLDDQISLTFDDEGGAAPLLADDLFDNAACTPSTSGEGHLILGEFGAAAGDLWIAMIDAGACLEQEGNTGVLFAHDDADGHVVHEAAVGLDGAFALVAVAGQTFGLRVNAFQLTAGTTGTWPGRSRFDWPVEFARATLDGLLFADGFERDGTDWWSFVAP